MPQDSLKIFRAFGPECEGSFQSSHFKTRSALLSRVTGSIPSRRPWSFIFRNWSRFGLKMHIFLTLKPNIFFRRSIGLKAIFQQANLIRSITFRQVKTVHFLLLDGGSVLETLDPSNSMFNLFKNKKSLSKLHNISYYNIFEINKIRNREQNQHLFYFKISLSKQAFVCKQAFICKQKLADEEKESTDKIASNIYDVEDSLTYAKQKQLEWQPSPLHVSSAFVSVYR